MPIGRIPIVMLEVIKSLIFCKVWASINLSRRCFPYIACYRKGTPRTFSAVLRSRSLMSKGLRKSSGRP